MSVGPNPIIGPLNDPTAALIQSLMGTMSGTPYTGPALQQPLASPQAQQAQDQDLARLQAQVAASSQAAEQAGQQYRQAAGAPLPMLGPMDRLALGLTGNLASVIGGNPQYARAGQEELVNQQALLLKQRADNLTALRDNFDLRARAAEHAQDVLTAGELRMKAEQLNKTLGMVLQQQKDAASMERVQERGTQARQTQQAGEPGKNYRAGLVATGGVGGLGGIGGGPAGGASPIEQDILRQVVTAPSGTKLVDLTNVPTKQHMLALDIARRNNLIVSDKGTIDRVKTIKEVLQGLDDMQSVLQKYLPTTAGGRIVSAPANLAAAWSGANPELSAFGQTRLLAIRNIQGLAAGQGSGFRLNQAEVNASTRNWPKITDSLPMAQAKIDWERRFYQNKERSLVDPTFQPRIEPDAGTAAAGRAGEPGWVPDYARTPVKAHSRAVRK